jgi:hypothetical protein
MATFIPESPDALLTRSQTAAALNESGFPTSEATLATQASRGGGPPFQHYGKRVLYAWSTTLNWAHSRLSPALRSTSDLRGFDCSTARRPSGVRASRPEIKAALGVRMKAEPHLTRTSKVPEESE